MDGMASESEILLDLFLCFFSPFKQDECKAGFDFNRNFLINPNAEWNIKPTEGLSLHQSSRSTRVSAGISETRAIKLLCAE